LSEPAGPAHLQDPPPPERSRAGLIPGILEGVIAVGLCIAVIAGLAYWQRDKIPFIANLLPTPTPVGNLYSNPAMGIRLYYPLEWVSNEDESGGMVTFSNSQAMLDGKGFPADAILLILIRRADLREEIPADVDPYNPEDLLRMVKSGENGIFSETAVELEGLRSYTLNGHPAASTIFLNTGTEMPPYIAYLVVIATDDIPVIAVVVLPQDGWESRRPAVDDILNTLEIQPMQ
jgi:hypothetical protein